MNHVEQIRNDPSPFVSSDTPIANVIALELVALSICEHTHSPHPIQIRLSITGEWTGVIEDTGRGMRLEPDVGDDISHAERALTSIYPVGPADEHAKAVLEELVWGPQGSQGPVLANALSAAFVFQSRRGGEVWEQNYRRGVPDGPACLVGATDHTGTRIRFLVDSGLAKGKPLDVDFLAARIEELRERLPGVDVTLGEQP